MLPPLSAWENRLKSSKPRPNTGSSVQADWYGWLPEAKLHLFRVYAGEFEACYMMLSVSLNEAIALRESGNLKKSFQVIEVISPLCSRLTDRLQGLLISLDEHAKHYGIIPSVAPLCAENFHGVRGQRAARMSSMFNRILLSQRAQFLRKIASLRDMLLELNLDFRDTAEELSSGAALDGRPLWQALDDDHFDLNTCFRESMILLKCFLRVLPDDQLTSFQKTVTGQRVPHTPTSTRTAMRHRRMAQFAGE
jgi:hypothetical protein